jgi:hypothetical protein
MSKYITVWYVTYSDDGLSGWARCLTEEEAINYAKLYWESSIIKAEEIRPDYMQELEEALKLALSFAPKGPVPEGPKGNPMFYVTGSYEGDTELQKRIDAARELLK